MKNNWQIPEWDRHFTARLRNGNYQQKQRTLALSYVEEFDLAIDIGANIGFWTRELCSKFKKVWAFEPSVKNCEYLKKNVIADNYELERIALSDKQDKNVELYATSSDSCGDLRLEKKDNAFIESYVDLKRLDDYIDKFEKVDFIKIDTQQSEREILLGAEQTLREFRPVLCVELPTRGLEELNYKLECERILNDFGYYEKFRKSKDTIYMKD